MKHNVKEVSSSSVTRRMEHDSCLNVEKRFSYESQTPRLKFATQFCQADRGRCHQHFSFISLFFNLS